MHSPAIWTPRKSLILPRHDIAAPGRVRHPIPRRASFISPGNPNPHRGFNYLSGDTGGESDPFFAFVKLLVHFDSSSGFLLDSGPLNLVISQIDPTRAAGQGTGKFGDASLDPTLSVPQDLSGLTTGQVAAFALVANLPITIEFWLRIVASPPVFNMDMPTMRDAALTINSRLLINQTGTVQATLYSAPLNFSGVSEVGTGYQFYAMTVDNVGVVRSYYNGNLVTTNPGPAAPNGPGGTQRVDLGNVNAAGTGTGSWQIDDFRLTIGGTDARYTGASFPVPTAAFPNS